MYEINPAAAARCSSSLRLTDDELIIDALPNAFFAVIIAALLSDRERQNRDLGCPQSAK
jgi:hypothetical protein